MGSLVFLFFYKFCYIFFCSLQVLLEKFNEFLFWFKFFKYWLLFLLFKLFCFLDFSLIRAILKKFLLKFLLLILLIIIKFFAFFYRLFKFQIIYKSFSLFDYPLIFRK